MNKHIVYISICCLIVLINGCTVQRKFMQTEMRPTPSLARELQQMFDDPQFYDSIWGVAIQSLTTNEFIYVRNEHINLIPASNVKLFTTAAALVRLSPDYRISTAIYRNGPITKQGVLEGDLIITGQGDPSISGRYYDGQISYVFKSWADSLQNYGIKKINGNIIGDDNYFDADYLGDGWAWDYETEWYAAQISALTYNDNCLEVIISPGDSINAPARIDIVPNVSYAEIQNRILTVDQSIPNQISYNRERGVNKITLEGQISLTSEPKHVWITIENPTLFFIESLKQSLTENGIETAGRAYDIDYIPFSYQKDDSLNIFTHLSPPLAKIIETVNKSSQNLFAELILRILGAQLKGNGSADQGIQVVREFITQIGINPSNFIMVDGSGLSRLNLVSAKDILALLKYMHTHPYRDSFIASLSVSGIDGTLKNRLNSDFTRGKVKAKTGYLGHAVSLSGYIEADQHHHYIFSMINNNYSTPTSLSQALQEAACERIINFSINP